MPAPVVTQLNPNTHAYSGAWPLSVSLGATNLFQLPGIIHAAVLLDSPGEAGSNWVGTPPISGEGWLAGGFWGNGADSYADYGYVGSTSGALSVGVWAYLPPDFKQGRLVSKGSVPDGKLSFEIQLQADGTFWAAVRGTTGQYKYSTSTAPLPVGAWTYVGFSWSGVNTAPVLLYVNGVQVAATTNQNDTFSTMYNSATSRLFFGHYALSQSNPNQCVRARIDRFHIYARVLTSDEWALLADKPVVTMNPGGYNLSPSRWSAADATTLSIPQVPPGSYSVTVTNLDGTSAPSPFSCTGSAPVITALDPASGVPGSSFSIVTPDSAAVVAVYFDGVPVAGWSASPTAITGVVVPEGASPGPYDTTLESIWGVSAPEQFTVESSGMPYIVSAYRDGDTLRIVGDNLTGPSPTILQWEGITEGVTIAGVISATSTELIYQWPFEGIYGYVNLRVHIPAGGGTSNAVLLTMPAPIQPPDPTAPGNIQRIPSYSAVIRELLMQQYKEDL